MSSLPSRHVAVHCESSICVKIGEQLSDNFPIREGQILTGSLFNEPMRVETVRAEGVQAWIVGLVGLRSEQFRRVTLIGILPGCSTSSDVHRNPVDRIEERRLLEAMPLAAPR